MFLWFEKKKENAKYQLLDLLSLFEKIVMINGGFVEIFFFSRF